MEPVGIDSNTSFRYTPSGMFYDRSIVTVYFNTSFKKGEQVEYSYTAPLDVSTFDILTRETVFRKWADEGI